MKPKTSVKRPTTLKDGPVRVSYAHVFEPRAMAGEEDGKKKYSVALLIPKSDTLMVKRIRKCIDAAIEEGKSKKWNGKIPASLRKPLRDGDAERPENPEYEGCWFLSATSDRKPGVIDRDGTELTSDDEFYSGCFARFIVNFFPYAAAGNKGVGCGLNHLQKAKDGERLSGRGDAASAFDDDYEFEDNDEQTEEEDDLMG
jgi:hypothetical protein